MVIEPKIKILFNEIQKQLFYMIPEKWCSLFLYASIFEHKNNIESGELFFYYIPVGILKKNPVNVYEIPNKFDIDEEQYMKLVDKLYIEIKKLKETCVELRNEDWKSIIISMSDFKFNVEYIFDELNEFNSYERHIIFKYKYLNCPFESFNKKERDVIYRYLNFILNNKVNKEIYSEAMYEKPFETIKANSKNSNIQYIKEEDEKLLNETREIKNQILKSGF